MSFKKAINSVVCIYMCIYASFTTHGQFNDVTISQLGIENINEGTIYGNGISFYDFDNDGRDDLTIGNGNEVPHFFRNVNGQFLNWDLGITNVEGALIHMILWVDYDNDADNDLLITRHGAPIQLWNNNGAMQFENVAELSGLEQENLDYWGASFADYDHDGCLDLFICKYYHPTFNPGVIYQSNLYKNNCDGTFSNVTLAAGINISPRPIFQSLFTDYDNDGWDDLFLVIDRIQFTNELFHNNGDGTFSNVTVASGTDQSICSMTGTIGDFDQDLDEDIFVSNGPNGNILLRNNNDETFSNQANELGVQLNQLCWGAVWIDYDNNTWEDLFISVTSPYLDPVGNQFFINEEGTHFTQSNNLVGLGDDPSETYQVATGDFNNDGYYDLIQNNKPPYISRLWENTGGNNHFFSLSLEGVISNKQGIGSRIYCHSEGKTYMRHTKCGENFISQNSGKEIFGLGQSSIIDSLEIFWNSGVRDVYYNPEIDSHQLFIEANSIIQPFNIYSSGSNILCENSTLILDAGEYLSYSWNNGESTRTIEVSTPGVYSVEVSNEFGFHFNSFEFVVIQAPTPIFEIAATNPTCAEFQNGSIVISDETENIESISWFNGSQEEIISELGSGSYAFELTDIWGCQTSSSINLIDPSEMDMEVITTSPKCFGENTGMAEVIISGGNPPYTFEWNGMNPANLSAGTYTVMGYDSNYCSSQSTFTITEPDELTLQLNIIQPTIENESSINLVIVGGVEPYQINWSNGSGNITSVEGLEPGIYYVEVIDDSTCSVSQKFELFLPNNQHEQELGIIEIYPNPFYNNLQITGTSQIIQTVRLFDLSGKKIIETGVHGNRFNLDSGNIGPGIYFVEVTINDGTLTRQIIKLNE